MCIQQKEDDKKMIVDLAFIAMGLIGLVLSADKFVDGASNLALHLKMSALLVGIIVVGIGTSAPEILVSSSAAMMGSDLALGNAIGSNISNIALIIGITSLFVPITVKKELLKKEFVLLIGSSFLGVYLLSDGFLSRMDAIILFLGLIFVMYFLISSARHPKEKEVDVKEDSESDKENLHIEMSLKKSIALTVFGMVALVGFSKLLVTGAVSLATALGVSDVVIGLTIVSVGTSLPELAACLAAAKKGNPDLAIGNIVGSNIFNILAVLSVSGMIFPMDVAPELIVRDLPLMGILTVGFLLVSFSPKGDAKINRFDGFIFLTIFVSYISVLVLESMGVINATSYLTGL